MSSQEDQLIATRRQEAAALLDINQRTRRQATAVLVVGLLVALAASLVAITAHDDVVLVPVPAGLFLLSALAFELFAEVSVTGAARRTLEDWLNRELGADVLIYETHVSGIRQRSPLVRGVRLLQAVWAAGVAGALVAGTIAAYEQRPAWPSVVFTVFTAASLFACVASYRDMLRAGRTADAAFGDASLQRDVDAQ
jgi:hypothetical protein